MSAQKQLRYVDVSELLLAITCATVVRRSVILTSHAFPFSLSISQLLSSPCFLFPAQV